MNGRMQSGMCMRVYTYTWEVLLESLRVITSRGFLIGMSFEELQCMTILSSSLLTNHVSSTEKDLEIIFVSLSFRAIVYKNSAIHFLYSFVLLWHSNLKMGE